MASELEQSECGHSSTKKRNVCADCALRALKLTMRHAEYDNEMTFRNNFNSNTLTVREPEAVTIISGLKRFITGKSKYLLKNLCYV